MQPVIFNCLLFVTKKLAAGYQQENQYASPYFVFHRKNHKACFNVLVWCSFLKIMILISSTDSITYLKNIEAIKKAITDTTIPYINTLYPFLKSLYFLPNTMPCEYKSLMSVPYKKSRSFIICFIPTLYSSKCMR